MEGRQLVLVTLAALAVVVASNALASSSGVRYAGGGTLVAKEAGVDDGAVLCAPAAGTGVGGGCLPFSAGPNLVVKDDLNDLAVAFQVCIDVDGDGLCSAPTEEACSDFLAFSHDDAGNFFNPIGPLPTSIAAGCAGGFAGYVVFLCEGVHAGKGRLPVPTPHAHGASGGTIEPSTLGSGGLSGDFCLPETPVQAKAYRVVG